MLNLSLQTVLINAWQADLCARKAIPCALGAHSWNMITQQSPYGALGMYKKMEVTCYIIFIMRRMTEPAMCTHKKNLASQPSALSIGYLH